MRLRRLRGGELLRLLKLLLLLLLLRLLPLLLLLSLHLRELRVLNGGELLLGLAPLAVGLRHRRRRRRPLGFELLRLLLRDRRLLVRRLTRGKEEGSVSEWSARPC